MVPAVTSQLISFGVGPAARGWQREGGGRARWEGERGWGGVGARTPGAGTGGGGDSPVSYAQEGAPGTHGAPPLWVAGSPACGRCPGDLPAPPALAAFEGCGAGRCAGAHPLHGGGAGFSAQLCHRQV